MSVLSLMPTRLFEKTKKRTIVYALCYLFCLSLLLVHFNSSGIKDKMNTKRQLWNYLGGGDCEWTGSSPFGSDADPYGTLFVGYPASGMRVTWQQTEGLTGMQVRDDFFELQYPKIGLVKTQYPHYEGIWSYGSDLDQTVLLIRNPRWAIPSYHTLINEIGYAHSWEVAYEELDNVFTRRAPMSDWINWRDYRLWEEIILWGNYIDFYMSDGEKYWSEYDFDEELDNVFTRRAPMSDWINWRDYRLWEEIILWGNYIDFYMSDGEKYWSEYDFERNGQWPFYFLNETQRPWPQDLHCQHDIECVPKEVISYERLRDPIVGPEELRKIANVLRGKDEINVIPDDGIECLWHQTWLHTPCPSNDDRAGPPREAYKFTTPQLISIRDKIVEYKAKYSAAQWVGNSNAIAIVENLSEYLIEIQGEIDELTANPPPTPAPDANYLLEVQDWYKSKGKGNRYDPTELKDKGIWDFISGFYPE
eukprot:CAMPEP_0194194038 /NCGR_PEP_ID=MMETSP0154-20130528/75362_1 /TAXON_ID=1049557 /ORGANISM="Thalassiothrix antarctica, Strain L6-D1" /LENGTH=475 /DNA_ID=CAMNT_0038918427 /DNA_START=680 /DNA_END=2107 /DNA_ORIENTATION=+